MTNVAPGLETDESQFAALAAEWRAILADERAKGTAQLTADESQLNTLADEWRAILVAEQQSSTALAAMWEIRFADLRAEHDELVRDGAWVGGPDDMLSILGLGRKELFHSALLAWLLDPRGRHGLEQRTY
ncbi:PD-(D/E)XK nuclease family protein [Sorangium sp. So ce204]|uniref:PD-(D/E)XK nuclease family protein n=1 Tax=Sorangium sp. So ce204 TaxID=3133288 RepID=UPI003F61193E